MLHRSGGHIVVVDRPALEAHACGCYAVVKRGYDGLLVDCWKAKARSRAHPVTRVRAFPQPSEVCV